MNEDNDKKNPPTADHDHKKPGDGDGKPDLPDKPIHFKVNDAELVSNHDKLVALDILEMAKDQGAIADKPENYHLEDTADGVKYEPEDWVPLKDGQVFVTVPQGATPVALDAAIADVVVHVEHELKNMGCEPVIETHPAYPRVAIIGYEVENGRFRGQMFRLGISMQGNEMWPEYPPHFIHVSPQIEDPRDGGVHGKYSAVAADGKEYQWSAFSRPPGPFWDNLPTKSMRGYMEHIRRFWSRV